MKLRLSKLNILLAALGIALAFSVTAGLFLSTKNASAAVADITAADFAEVDEGGRTLWLAQYEDDSSTTSLMKGVSYVVSYKSGSETLYRRSTGEQKYNYLPYSGRKAELILNPNYVLNGSPLSAYLTAPVTYSQQQDAVDVDCKVAGTELQNNLYALTADFVLDKDGATKTIQLKKNWSIVSLYNDVLDRKTSEAYGNISFDYDTPTGFDAPRPAHGTVVDVKLSTIAQEGEASTQLAQFKLTYAGTSYTLSEDSVATGKTFENYLGDKLKSRGVGRYSLSITSAEATDGGIKYYPCPASYTVTVRNLDITGNSDVTVTITGASTFSYSGAEKTTTCEVRYKGTLLRGNADYLVSFENNINAGTATLRIAGRGNYTGTVEKYFTIVGATDNTWTASLNIVPWFYGAYDSAANAIVGATKYGTENVKYIVTNSAGVVVSVEDLGTQPAGTYTLTATLDETANYNGLNASITFRILPATNTWVESPNIFPWKYRTFNASYNKIFGVAEHGTAVFNVTNADGRDLTGNFTIEDGIPEDVCEILYNLVSGNYYLNARVAQAENYTNLSAELAFSVDKADNGWVVSPAIIEWEYGAFDRNTHLIMAAVDNGDIRFTVTDMLDNDLCGGRFILEASSDAEGAQLIVPESVAAVLAGLEADAYKLTAYVSTNANFESVAPLSVIFAVKPISNSWIAAPNIIQWEYGTYDPHTHLITAIPKEGTVLFNVTDAAGNAFTEGALAQSFTLTNGIVPDDVSAALAALEQGKYMLSAVVLPDDNYTELMPEPITFNVYRTENVWEQTLSIVTWTTGKFNEKTNVITVQSKYGEPLITIVDANNVDKVYYTSGPNGTAELTKVLSKLGVGSYLLTATVEGTANYSALTSPAVLFKVFDKAGLPWWAIVLIVAGALGIVAIVLYVLHEKGVLQLLTSRVVIAMRTKMSVDATIAAVRANKIAEAARISIAEAEKRDREEAEKLAAQQAAENAQPAEEQAKTESEEGAASEEKHEDKE